MGRSIEQLSFLINSPYKLFHTKTALGYQLVAGRNRVGKQGVIIALLSLALVCISLNPVTLWAATHTAASCSRYDVGNAVNSAGHGGTINDVYNKGIVLIEGASHQFRIDHCKFIPTESAGLVLHGDLWGVIDHNVFDVSAHHGYAVYVHGDAYGDASWAQGSTLGT